MNTKAELISPDLFWPTPSEVLLPRPSIAGRFLVTPDELVHQLLFGDNNPMYGHAETPDRAIECISAWRAQVIASDHSATGDGEPQMYGSHLTNSIARIALMPCMRRRTFSLKNVYKQEEFRFPKQGSGRDPENLAVLYNSLRASSSSH